MPDTELDGFEREGEGGVLIHMFYIHVYMSKTKIVYIKFFLILLGCFLGGWGGGGGSMKGCYPRHPLLLCRCI